ncbi:OmpA family protein [Candidatus Dependentiae bacterium]|nr:OmpA family protein [Candidatus Dependentiae bacterium]
MKKLGLLCVVLALFLSGCGKKKSAHEKTSHKTSGKLLRAGNDVPVMETENFFDDQKVADFAFVDDESMIENGGSVVTDGFDIAELDRVKGEAALTTAALEDLVESVNELERGMNDDDSLEFQDLDNVIFKTVHFDLNRNEIRPDQAPIVKEDIKLAQQAVLEGKDVVVQGHSCQLGPDSYNLALSQRRAEAIKKEMTAHGVDSKHIKTVGCGNEMPIVWSDARDKKALINELAPNRRAEILIN